MKAFLSIVVASLLSFSSIPFVSAAEAKVSDTQAQAVVQDVININTADVDTLTRLKGIGVKKAEAIVAWREAYGQFVSVDQLIEVKGIGAAILELNRERMRI